MNKHARSSMAWSLPAGKKLLLLLVVATTLALEQSTATDGARSISMSLPGCPDKCGDLVIPYPFGFKEGCFREGFNVTCDETTSSAYLRDDGSFKIFDFNLSQGEVRVRKRISYMCNNGTNNTSVPHQMPVLHLNNSLFSVSTKNRFTAIGCATFAIIYGNNQHNYTSGCVSYCGSHNIDDSTECTGTGCCQTSIPDNLWTFGTAFFELPSNSTYFAQDFSPCSYAFVAEQDWFNFSTSYANSTKFADLYGGLDNGVPMLLDWVVANGTCSVDANKMGSSYACTANNSVCVNASSGMGYQCSCRTGYEGNPYLQDGCQDINECDNPYMYPCHGHCRNTDGDYTCVCPHGTHSDDPKTTPCARGLMIRGLIIAIAVGSPAGSLFLFLGVIFLIRRFKHMREIKLKRKYFKQNRGQLLQQLVSHNADIAERMIISMDELAKATNNFDKARELGGGGHGTVYKGILSDQHVVAIKKPKTTVQDEIDEFINEVAILSQINHRNVVKLFGCCLETEVPLLVYEFISNRTVYHHLHVEGPRSLPWVSRLRIATETSSALAYLHSSASTPIIHRDIKSSNILLDDALTSKVADFGASRYIPIDKTGLTTRVQGTRGYLDPMYFYTWRLTEKSDVYSFGVFLVELLTRKKPFSYLSSDGDGLVSHFVNLLDKENLGQILDPQVIEEGGKEVEEVAVLAASCIKLTGEERPTMQQVELALKSLEVSKKDMLTENTEENGIGGQRMEESSRRYSLEQEFLLSARYPR